MNKAFFDQWAQNKWVEFASVMNWKGSRVRWEVNLSGEHQVLVSDAIVYSGHSFYSAREAWENNR